MDGTTQRTLTICWSFDQSIEPLGKPGNNITYLSFDAFWYLYVYSLRFCTCCFLIPLNRSQDRCACKPSRLQTIHKTKCYSFSHHLLWVSTGNWYVKMRYLVPVWNAGIAQEFHRNQFVFTRKTQGQGNSSIPNRAKNEQWFVRLSAWCTSSQMKNNKHLRYPSSSYNLIVRNGKQIAMRLEVAMIENCRSHGY